MEDQLLNLQNPKLISFQYIFNLMQRYQGLIKFFDVRDQESFNKDHLRIAIHIPIDQGDLNLQNLETLIKERPINRLRRYCIIIGHSEHYTQEAKDFKNLLKNLKCKEINMITDIEEFLERYSFLCISFKTIRVNDFPNEIIPKFLYLGSQGHAHCREVIEILQVTHILNVTRGAANLFPGLKYCRVFVDDNETEKISLYFQKAYEFIDSALEDNANGGQNIVLVHCAKGVSRSSTIVIMFLMRSAGMLFEEAFEFVKKNRDIIEPNEGFKKELKDFDKHQHQFVRRASTLSTRAFSLKDN